MCGGGGGVTGRHRLHFWRRSRVSENGVLADLKWNCHLHLYQASQGTGAVWVFSRVSSGGCNGDLRHREGSGRQHKAARLGPGVSDVVVTPSTSLFRL